MLTNPFLKWRRLKSKCLVSLAVGSVKAEAGDLLNAEQGSRWDVMSTQVTFALLTSFRIFIWRVPIVPISRIIIEHIRNTFRRNTIDPKDGNHNNIRSNELSSIYRTEKFEAIYPVPSHFSQYFGRKSTTKNWRNPFKPWHSCSAKEYMLYSRNMAGAMPPFDWDDSNMTYSALCRTSSAWNHRFSRWFEQYASPSAAFHKRQIEHSHHLVTKSDLSNFNSHQMALIIPFRDRYEQLSVFVRHMHPLLKRQKLDYRIFVVEQVW